MELISEILHCTPNQNSDECGIVHCNNSQAIEAGRHSIKTPTIECGFCNNMLEQTGFYLTNSIFSRGWLSRGEYERCGCKDAEKYWVEFDEQLKLKKENEEKKEAERQYKERLEKMIKQSNLGEKFKTRTFTTFKISNENKVAHETCRRYAEKFKALNKKGIGLLITGNYGAGKTHLAAAIAHELIKQNYQPIFGTLITLLGKVKASYGDTHSKENEEQIINRYINCDLLIIDDLGKEKPTEWILEKLYYIVNCRYENNKPITITSNYNDTKLMDRLTVGDNLETSEAIVSRMFEMCQGVNMQECKDYRREI
ncbi:ATP-binding protein [Clostridium sp. FP1]|uniref:ATP-binding protein n=1 Tax=Clostridium sp. FP1 TaxID=2724076 RepID=UPI0013E91680|nr:ATP-binding protein [Clostridium sp. FP1]MBZ9635618.1 ATP-binding protein [Clostridium sp. FP1]